MKYRAKYKKYLEKLWKAHQKSMKLKQRAMLKNVVTAIFKN